MTVDDNVVGCVALHEYPAEHLAEVACLYVKLSHEGRGYGADLVLHAEALAVQRGVPQVYALTNRAAEFFEHRMGYSPAEKDVLPATRRAQLEASGRDSRVFVKSL
nr:GNAT family N-acetyltransferase [Haloferula luteola]